MITRREFLRHAAIGTLGLISASAFSRAFGEIVEQNLTAFKGEDVFSRLLKKSLAGHWEKLPIGQCMTHVAMELQGTPYVGFTLELDKDHELCSVNLKGLDCVTFFEDTLDFSAC